MSQAIPVAQLKSITMSIYRYDPSLDDKPYMQDIVIEVPTDKDIMVLDALHPVSYTHLTLPTILRV